MPELMLAGARFFDSAGALGITVIKEEYWRKEVVKGDGGYMRVKGAKSDSLEACVDIRRSSMKADRKVRGEVVYRCCVAIAGWFYPAAWREDESSMEAER
jgi:hypothetical protein